MSARAYLLPPVPAYPAPQAPLAPPAASRGFIVIDVEELPNGLWEVRGDRGLFGGRFRTSEAALRYAIDEGRRYRRFVLQMIAQPQS